MATRTRTTKPAKDTVSANERIATIESKLEHLVESIEERMSLMEKQVEIEQNIERLQDQTADLVQRLNFSQFVKSTDRSYFDEHMERYTKNKIEISHKLVYIVGALCTGFGWLIANLVK